MCSGGCQQVLFHRVIRSHFLCSERVSPAFLTLSALRRSFVDSPSMWGCLRLVRHEVEEDPRVGLFSTSKTEKHCCQSVLRLGRCNWIWRLAGQLQHRCAAFWTTELSSLALKQRTNELSPSQVRVFRRSLESQLRCLLPRVWVFLLISCCL